MSGAEREMTLAEWVGRLPDSHAASKEYDALLRERDEAAALLRWCDEHWQNHIYEGSPSVHFLSRLAAFLAPGSATHRENDA